MHIHECIEIKERNLLRGEEGGEEEGIFHLDLLKLQNPNRETSFVSPTISSSSSSGKVGWTGREVGNLEYAQLS